MHYLANFQPALGLAATVAGAAPAVMVCHTIAWHEYHSRHETSVVWQGSCSIRCCWQWAPAFEAPGACVVLAEPRLLFKPSL